MGVFGGGNSKSSSSTSVDIPTVTANQQSGSAPVVGGIYLSTEGGAGKGSSTNSSQALTVNITDSGAVNQAIGLSGDAASRAAAITSQSIAELGAERANLVNLVAAFGQQNDRYADLSAGSQQVAAAAAGAASAAGERVGAVELFVDKLKKWAWAVPMLGAAWYAFKR